MFFLDKSHSLKVFLYITAIKFEQNVPVIISQVDKVCFVTKFICFYCLWLTFKPIWCH